MSNKFKNSGTNKWVNSRTSKWLQAPPQVIIVGGGIAFEKIMKLKRTAQDENFLLILIAFMTAENGEII